MRGIIYKYTSPENKVYIGQTIDEEARRLSFKRDSSYAGVKINLARAKFNPINIEG